MTIEITKGSENSITEFFSSPSNTPETDAACACFKGYTEPLQDVQDLSRKLERERDEWRKSAFEITEQATKSRKELERERDEARADAAQLADRLSGLELRTTEELARLERERDEARNKYDELATEHMLVVNKLCKERDDALKGNQ
jgi:flagellar motility protein MotE (MotC chaperone)